MWPSVIEATLWAASLSGCPPAWGRAARHALARIASASVRRLLYGLRMRPMVWIAVALLWAGQARAEWYSYRDASGTLHVTDQLSRPDQVSASVATLAYGAQPASTPPAEARSPNSLAPAAAAAVAAHASAAPPPGDALADRQRRLETRLRSNEAHLALLRAQPAGAASAEMENELTDAVRADSAALAALRGGSADSAP